MPYSHMHWLSRGGGGGGVVSDIRCDTTFVAYDLLNANA